MSSLQAAHEVLRQFPCAISAHLVPLGNRGGFSGARLWRVEATDWQGCLRAWPIGGMTVERLSAIHHLMHIARAAGLNYVPSVYVSRSGQTYHNQAGRLWDLTSWLPGCADFHQQPSTSRLQAAVVALARLHNAWGQTITHEPCPAVMRRLATAREWLALVDSHWQPHISGDDPVGPVAKRAWQWLPAFVAFIPQQLTPWRNLLLPVQPCLCDIWHDHVLFTGDTVTGIVDYGSIKRDNVAVDLARLLGSIIGDEAALRTVGINAYQQVRPLSLEEQGLIGVLDQTGVVLGTANWLMWLYHEGRTFADRQAVARRVAALVDRLAKWL